MLLFPFVLRCLLETLSGITTRWAEPESNVQMHLSHYSVPGKTQCGTLFMHVFYQLLLDIDDISHILAPGPQTTKNDYPSWAFIPGC